MRNLACGRRDGVSAEGRAERPHTVAIAKCIVVVAQLVSECSPTLNPEGRLRSEKPSRKTGSRRLNLDTQNPTPLLQPISLTIMTPPGTSSNTCWQAIFVDPR